MAEPPKRLVLKLARTGSDQWAVAPASGALTPTPAAAASHAESAPSPVVKVEPKEEKTGKLIIRLKAPAPRPRADSDSDDGGKPDAKRQRKPSLLIASSGGAASYNPLTSPSRASQREPKPARHHGDDTSSHRDEDDDEIEVSGGSVSASHDRHERRQKAASNVMIPLRKAMSSLVAHLIKKDYFGIFYEPVDPDDVPDYYDHIKQPMCFKTIRKKLADDLYPSLKALEEDVELICTNSMQYNPPGSHYHEEARKLQAESRSKFIDYAPRTVQTLPPKKARDYGKDAAARSAAAGGTVVPAPGVVGSLATTPIRPLTPGGLPAAPGSVGSRPAPGAPGVSPANVAAYNALASPPGRRYATPPTPQAAAQQVRRPQQLSINNGVLPATAGGTPGTADAKATYAYNPAVPGRPNATATSAYSSSAQNYINTPTRAALPVRPPQPPPPAVEEQQYQSSLESFVKGAGSAEAQKQVELLMTRLKNPQPLGQNSATLAEVVADLNSQPKEMELPFEEIPGLVDSINREYPGVDLSFLLRVLPARGAEPSVVASDTTGDKEVQRELDRNYESLVRLHQLHHQRPSSTPVAPAPAESALAHALSLSLALLAAKVPIEALHPVSSAVPSLKEAAAGTSAAAAALVAVGGSGGSGSGSAPSPTNTALAANGIGSSAPSPPAPVAPTAMETN